MQKIEVENHSPSYLPEGEWKLAWADEFDGNTLDESKWNFREYFWGKKSPTFTREGVSVDGNSNLVISLVKKGDDYFSGHLQTGSYTNKKGDKVYTTDVITDRIEFLDKKQETQPDEIDTANAQPNPVEGFSQLGISDDIPF